MKERGFEVVSKYNEKEINLPVRSTKYAAGYDIECCEDTIIEKGKIKLVPTGIKVYCQDDEYIMLVNRSSSPKKKGIVLANGIGIVDKDYYNNENNEGEIFFQFINITDEDVLIKKGDRIGQALFQKYYLSDNDEATGDRTGGFGSTGK